MVNSVIDAYESSDTLDTQTVHWLLIKNQLHINWILIEILIMMSFEGIYWQLIMESVNTHDTSI